MSPFDDPHERLTAEWLALPDLTARQCGDLETAGVSRPAIQAAGGLAWCRAWSVGRTWQPSAAGKVHIVLPVWNGPAPSIHRAVEKPQLVDMVAFRLERPCCWFYRCGAPGAVLGAAQLDFAHETGCPIVLFTTPLHWLRHGCAGTVLLEDCEAAWRAREPANAFATSTAISPPEAA